MAVDLAKLSLWLATLAKDHPFTFLDHSLRCGDSLVGLTQEQIAAFHWSPPKKHSAEDVWFGDPIAERMQRVTAYRQRILAARDDKPYEQLRQELGVADDAMSLAKLTGDLVIAAFFAASKDRQRSRAAQRTGPAVGQIHGQAGDGSKTACLWQEAVNELRSGDGPSSRSTGRSGSLKEFSHRSNKNLALTHSIGEIHRLWLAALSRPILVTGIETGYCKCIHSHMEMQILWLISIEGTFDLLREYGCLGLIATNTIAQGDTRSTGLRWLCTHDGIISRCKKAIQMAWPSLCWWSASFTSAKARYMAAAFSMAMKLILSRHIFFMQVVMRPRLNLPLTTALASMAARFTAKASFFVILDVLATPLIEMHRLVKRILAIVIAYSVHWWPRSERQPESCVPPLCDQLRGNDGGGGPSLARFNEDSGRQSTPRTHTE